MGIRVNGNVIESNPNKKMLDVAKELLENPNFEPVQPRFAATVMLVRNSKPGQTPYRIEDGVYPENFPTGQEMEVFMLRRVKTMEFVPDAVVFPGGRVDEKDAERGLKWAGPTPEQWAAYMNVDEETARKVVVAAAREVFEECGVLLAGYDNGQLVSDLSDPSWQEDRRALESHELALSEMLMRRNLALRTDLLGLIANFCTPEYEPKRYDTFFFSALMPEGQVADDKTSEAQIAGWVTPAYTMREGDANRWLVLPPTVYNLTCIANAHDAEEFVSTRKTLHKIMSKPFYREDGSIGLRGEIH